MATWEELKDAVRANFKIANEEPDMVMMFFETENDRSQSVILARQTLMGGEEDWLQIMSPIADLSSAKVDMQAALEAAGDIVCGGLALVGPLLVIRHAVPLENLDINEFMRPLMLVTMTADELEQTLVGSDAF